MPEKADDAGGLSPIKEENAFRRNSDRRASGCFIKNSYYISQKTLPRERQWGFAENRCKNADKKDRIALF